MTRTGKTSLAGAAIDGQSGGEPSAGTLIRSLQRGLGILEVIARQGPGVSMADVAREVGLHTSTAFHLLRTLVTLGYLVQDEVTRHYRLGPTAFQLVGAAWSESQLSEAAVPFLSAVARETGESTHLAVFDRGGAVMIHRVDGNAPVRLAERVGYARPAYCTAIGKILLAALPPDELAAYLASTPLERRSPKTVTARAAVEREIERVRTQGFAFDDEEYTEGIRCVAAPVRNFTGRVVAALGLSGPVWRVTLDRVASLTDVVRTAATRLSAHLGEIQRGEQPAARQREPAAKGGRTPAAAAKPRTRRPT